ncbi:MAG: PH domain-containing protein [Steroidobacteraceae bacterium]|jgi:hypothetical protein|nr:PH domain-containing protein [Steroidobacteraceae bacterium]
MSDDFDGEPIHGLPQRPPAGERILWQGAPQWRATALRTFHVRKVAAYFAVLFAWGVLDALIDGETGSAALLGSLKVLPVGLLVIGALAGLAAIVARTTVYTITTQRVVMRFGIALPMAVNFPFRLVAGAAIKDWPDGSGNIPLKLHRGARVGYVVMWPHVRPWHLAQPQPMLRGIADVRQVAATLARALVEAEPALAAQAAQAEVRAGTGAPPGAGRPGSGTGQATAAA